MRSGVAFSAVMHVALAILIVVGLPLAKKKLAPLPPPVAIEIVTIAEKTNPPKGKKRAVKAKKPTPKPPQTRQAAAPKKPEPKPKPPVKKAEKPKPKPVAKPKPPVKKAEKPKPKSEPKKEPKVASLPKPKAKKEPPPKPEPKPQAAQPAPQPRVKAKPAPKPKAKPRPRKRMSLAQLLESANKLKPRAKTGKREREAPTARRGSPRHDPSQKLSMSELDALKRQLAPMASAATRLRASAMPPEATKGIVSSAATRGSRMKLGTSSSPGWPAHSKPSTETASQPIVSAFKAWRSDVHLWIILIPAAFRGGRYCCGLRPAVSTMGTPPSTIARTKPG